MAERTFKDALGREWCPRVDGEVVFRYEDRTGIDLFVALGSGNPIKAVPGARALMTLLWLSVEAKAGSVTEVEFRKALHGEAIEKATKVLVEAVFDFFPSLRSALAGALPGMLAGTGARGASATSSSAPPSQE